DDRRAAALHRAVPVPAEDERRHRRIGAPVPDDRHVPLREVPRQHPVQVRLRGGDRVVSRAADRAVRIHQLLHRQPHQKGGPLMAAVSSAIPKARGRRAVARRFDSGGPLTYLFLILVVVGSIFPLYWSLVVASHTNAAVYEYPPKLLPGSNLFHNFHRLFNSGVVSVDFAQALVNSAIVASVVTVCVVFFSALPGVAFARLESRGRKLLFVLVLATLIVPVQLGLIPLYIEMTHFCWLNSLKPVMAPNLVTAFGVFLMRQYIVGAVPNELIAAARVDGCNSWRVFWHVVLPAVRPIAAVLGLLTFMNTWNDFLWPYIVLNARNPTVQVAISDIATVAYVPDYSLILTACFVAILPLLLVFLVLGRQIVGGIMQGAVKG